MGIEEFLLDQAKREGVKEGEKKGKAEGKTEEAIAIAIEMKKDGILAEQIAKFTRLPIAEIEKLCPEVSFGTGSLRVY